jgi:hypothetical protein
MGGGGSRPAPPPTVVEQEPPKGSGQSSIIYADRPDTPRLDGLTRSLSNDCNGCSLQIKSGISSSSVKLSREFGEVTDVQCKRFTTDWKRVNEKQMSFQDFLGNLQAGRYLRNLNNGYCEQVILSPEELQKVKKPEQFDMNRLESVRIQKLSSGGFSSDTKAKLTPSIPFKLSFMGQEITVKTMSVYHPCPLRIEGIQPDAVFSLNDPSFDDGSGYIILVPLIAKNTADPSIEFFDRVLPQINAVTAPEATGQYMTRNIATGTNWSLTKVFSAVDTAGGSFEVKNGYYEWKGMPALERVREDGNNTITYSWKESGKPSPRYIMLDTPVAISSSSLSSITQSLPVTPSSDAIHAVLYSSNPLQRGIVHKQGPPNPSCMRESFADMNGVKEEFCDDWTAWAQNSEPKGYTTQQIFGLIFNVLVFIAMGVGAYIALSAVLREYHDGLSNVSTGLGKITAMVFKSLRQKAGEMKGMTSMMQNPLAGLKVPSIENPLAALQTAVAQPVAAVQKAVDVADTSKEDAKVKVNQQLQEVALKSEKRRQAAAEARKKADEERAAAIAAAAAVEARKKAEAAAEAKQKADEEAAKKADEEAAKKAADKKKRDEQFEEVALKAKQRREAAAKQKEAEAERKKKEEELAAEAERKKKEEELVAKQKEAEAERKKKAEDEEIAAKKKAEDETAAKKKAEKEARVVPPPSLPKPKAKDSTASIPTPQSETPPPPQGSPKPTRNVNTKKLVPLGLTKPSSAKSTTSKTTTNNPNLNQAPRYMQPKKKWDVPDTESFKAQRGIKKKGGKPRRGRDRDGSTRRAGY